MTTPPSDDLFTVAEAAEYLHTPPRFIRRLVAEKRIAYSKVGRYVRLRRSDLDAFVEAGRVEAEEIDAPTAS